MQAVCAFQHQRGLRDDGVCGTATWSALVEAGYELGDRLLYLRSPMLRGDDVAELQRQLGALGFDAGRIDGIFGAQAEAALLDFQRNAGLTADGICGPEGRSALARFGARLSGTGEAGIAGIRERETLRAAPRTLADRWIVIGQTGGLDQLAVAASRSLHEAGANVITLHDPDDSVQAATTNEVGAEVYVGLSTAATPAVAYYATTGFESTGGRQLAHLLSDRMGAALSAADCPVRGMALPVLRETRMPAVVAEVGPPGGLAPLIPALADAVTGALTAWVETPVQG